MHSKILSFFVASIAMSLGMTAAHAGEITVSAAASLTNAFKDIAQNYQTQYPDARVSLNFGASGSLLQQIAKGAPVDVFASADQETMDTSEKQGLVAAADRRDFVKNSLVLIAPADSKLAVKHLDELNQPGVRHLAIGNPSSVPAGRYTQHALEAARLWAALETRFIHTQSVRQCLDYVARGEVDGGFVYATDAAIMKDKVKVLMEVPLNVAISYPIAKIKTSNNSEEAKRFIAYLYLPQSQAILTKYGFQKP